MPRYANVVSSPPPLPPRALESPRAVVAKENTESPSTEEKPESEDRMAIMAAVAMTELLGKATRRVSTDASSKTAGEKRKAVEEEPSTPVDSDSPSVTTTGSDEPTGKRPKTTATTVSAEGSPVRDAESRNPSPVSTVIITSPNHSHHTHHPAPKIYPFYPSPQHHGLPRASPCSYEEAIKSSGLPKALSFRKICSKCGKTRGEHGELGFGNKCVYQDCGKCGAGVQVHLKAGVPMGILCRLTVEEGAVPGAAACYERKIRDLAARAELQKTLLEDKRERVERLAQNVSLV